jgi:outer membrane lipoprotein-sorting protein
MKMSLAGTFALLLAAAACAAAMGAAPATTRAASAEESLADNLQAMQQVKLLKTHFVCEKRVAALDTPLVSSGTIWIGRPDSVRFSTERPYLSELILNDGQVLSRNQHDEQWTKSPQANRPGLTAIMGQMTKWSMGETQNMRQAYTIDYADVAVPPPPSVGSEKSEGGVAAGPSSCYLLKPRDKTVAEAIRDIVLVVDDESHYLRLVRIVSTQGDQTTYWFDRTQSDVKAPPDLFTPQGVK